jgi:Bifunctional DNA primase/polymerase, N-terminal
MRTDAVTPTFLSIIDPLRARGLKTFTPVTPDGKCGAQKNWPNFQLVSNELANAYAGPGKRFEHFNAGIVGKEGINNLCFFDIDAAGVTERIESETGKKLPAGYTVCTRPDSAPHKRHFYYRQTPYSVQTFRKFFEARGHRRREKKGKRWTKNLNIKSLTEFNKDGGYLNQYDLKGVGGGSLVVAEGSVRPDGQRYTCIDQHCIPPIPDWLVNWVIEDFKQYEAGKERIRLDKLKKKQDIRKRYSKQERAVMRQKNLQEGFDILFEDRYGFLRWRSGTYASMGLSPAMVEKALAEQAITFVQNGAAFMETDAGKEMVHKLATSDNQRGNASWFYRRKDHIDEFYAFDTDTELGYQKRLPFIIKQTVRSERHEAMLGIVHTFPDKIHKDTAYTRLDCELRALGYSFDRKLGKDQEATAEVRKKIGFEVNKPFWIRVRPVALVGLREEG